MGLVLLFLQSLFLSSLSVRGLKFIRILLGKELRIWVRFPTCKRSELLFTSRTQKSRNSVNCYKSSHSAGERSEVSLGRRWCCDRIEAAIAYDHEVRDLFGIRVEWHWKSHDEESRFAQSGWFLSLHPESLPVKAIFCYYR